MHNGRGKVYNFPMSKVLLVDDEPRILLLLQSLLKTNKYEVETAREGKAALDLVNKFKPKKTYMNFIIELVNEGLDGRKPFENDNVEITSLLMI